MPTFIDRLKTEIGEVSARHTALKNFIAENPTYKSLDTVDQGLMALQEHHMGRYVSVLLQRYDRLTLGMPDDAPTFPKSDV